MQTKEDKNELQRQYHIKNREKINIRKKEYYVENKKKIAVRNKSYSAAIRRKNGLLIFEYKGGRCFHCGVRERNNLEIYDYHHIDPSTKLYNIGLILKGPLDRLMTEVDKCLLLCSNCHRKEHVRLNNEGREQ